MLWQAGRMFLGVKILCLDLTCVTFRKYTYGFTTSERCKRMLENVMRHTRSRIKSYDQQIARVKAEISWMTPWICVLPEHGIRSSSNNCISPDSGPHGGSQSRILLRGGKTRARRTLSLFYLISYTFIDAAVINCHSPFFPPSVIRP